MKIVTPVVIIPEAGENVWEVAKKIACAINSGKIGTEAISLRIPDDSKDAARAGTMISIQGVDADSIRDCIATQYKYSHF